MQTYHSNYNLGDTFVSSGSLKTLYGDSLFTICSVQFFDSNEPVRYMACCYLKNDIKTEWFSESELERFTFLA